MRAILAMLVVAASVRAANAGPARSWRRAGDLHLTFFDGGDAPVRRGAADDASIDVGRVVAARCGGRACTRTVVRKRFRLRVDGRARTRFVRVSAYVDDATPGQLVRIDGRIVGDAPEVISATAPVGVALAHTIEIEVAATAPEGPLAHNVTWLVEDTQ